MENAAQFLAVRKAVNYTDNNRYTALVGDITANTLLVRNSDTLTMGGHTLTVNGVLLQTGFFLRNRHEAD